MRLFTKTRNTMNLLIIFGLAFIFVPVISYADDFLDTKPNLMWLSGDINLSVFDQNTEYDSFVGRSELWSDKWGISASLLQNERDDVFGLPEDSEYFNLDVKRRFGSKEKSSFALGLGWQELSIDSQFEASGPKISLSGEVNVFNSLKVYGLTSWLPDLEETGLDRNDATAYELEAGVLYQPLPSISLRAGYRHFSLDLEGNNQSIEDLGSSSGFLLGTDLSW